MCAPLFIPFQYVSRDKHKTFCGYAAYYGKVFNGSPCISYDPVTANFTIDSSRRIHKYPRAINGEYVARGVSPTPPPPRPALSDVPMAFRPPLCRLNGRTDATDLQQFRYLISFKYPVVCSQFLIYSITVRFVNNLCYAVLNMYMCVIIIIIIIIVAVDSARR
jgi:hypothetical protein